MLLKLKDYRLDPKAGWLALIRELLLNPNNIIIQEKYFSDTIYPLYQVNLFLLPQYNHLSKKINCILRRPLFRLSMGKCTKICKGSGVFHVLSRRLLPEALV